MSPGFKPSKSFFSPAQFFKGLIVTTLLKQGVTGIIKLFGHSPFQYGRHDSAYLSRMFFILDSISMGLKGFTMYSSAPTSLPRSCSATWPLAVSMIT